MATDNQGLHLQDPVRMGGRISNSCSPVKATNSQCSFIGLSAVKHSIILAQYIPYTSYYFQIVNISKFWTILDSHPWQNFTETWPLKTTQTSCLHLICYWGHTGIILSVIKQSEVVPWTRSVSEIIALNILSPSFVWFFWTRGRAGQEKKPLQVWHAI